MSTNSRGEVSEFDYEELANQLMEQGLSASPSELHGCLCGLLASGARHEGEAGLNALNQALDLDLHGELAEQVIALHVSTALSLEDEQFDFHPLLMDDSDDLIARTAALAGWCRGFLSGYAQLSATAERPRVALPGDSSEILRDLAAIAEAEVDDEQAEEESEKHYAELAEYIRFAALNAYMDRLASDADDLPADPSERRLH